jgi:hypothetical protein
MCALQPSLAAAGPALAPTAAETSAQALRARLHRTGACSRTLLPCPRPSHICPHSLLHVNTGSTMLSFRAVVQPIRAIVLR